jgi:SHS2 domain-containing protein
MIKYKFLKHTADIKFQAFGKNVEEVFENSALALKEIICGKIKVKNSLKKKIKISGKDFESLLYKFLEEIIYFLEGEKFVISKIENLEVKNFKLTAEIFGDKTANYNFTNKVKAVTYNDMFVKSEKKKWISQVVIDV